MFFFIAREKKLTVSSKMAKIFNRSPKNHHPIETLRYSIYLRVACFRHVSEILKHVISSCDINKCKTVIVEGE